MTDTLFHHLPTIKGEMIKREFYVSNGRRIVVEITNKGTGLFDLHLSFPANLRFRNIREQNISPLKVEYVWKSFVKNINMFVSPRTR